MGQLALVEEVDEQAEDRAPICELHPAVLLLATDEWSRVHCVIGGQPARPESGMELLEVAGDVIALVVEDEAEDVERRVLLEGSEVA